MFLHLSFLAYGYTGHYKSKDGLQFNLKKIVIPLLVKVLPLHLIQLEKFHVEVIPLLHNFF